METTTNEHKEIIEKVIVYSKWNKLVIPAAEKKAKIWFNFFKYGVILLTAVIVLIALWFSTQWQSGNDLDQSNYFLKNIGIDISKYSDYLTSTNNKEISALIEQVKQYHLWDLQGSVISEAGVQALVAIGIISIFFLVPSLIFKNGTAWSIGSLAITTTLLIIVIALFALGLVSQASVMKMGSLAIPDQANIDLLTSTIQSNKNAIIKDTIIPEEIAINEQLQATIDKLNVQRDKILTDSNFMATLTEYLNSF